MFLVCLLACLLLVFWDRVLFFNLGWRWTYDSPASASQVLELSPCLARACVLRGIAVTIFGKHNCSQVKCSSTVERLSTWQYSNYSGLLYRNEDGQMKATWNNTEASLHVLNKTSHMKEYILLNSRYNFLKKAKLQYFKIHI
jgi:hypothetical protein